MGRRFGEPCKVRSGVDCVDELIEVERDRPRHQDGIRGLLQRPVQRPEIGDLARRPCAKVGGERVQCRGEARAQRLKLPERGNAGAVLGLDAKGVAGAGNPQRGGDEPRLFEGSILVDDGSWIARPTAASAFAHAARFARERATTALRGTGLPSITSKTKSR